MCLRYKFRYSFKLHVFWSFLPFKCFKTFWYINFNNTSLEWFEIQCHLFPLTFWLGQTLSSCYQKWFCFGLSVHWIFVKNKSIWDLKFSVLLCSDGLYCVKSFLAVLQIYFLLTELVTVLFCQCCYKRMSSH